VLAGKNGSCTYYNFTAEVVAAKLTNGSGTADDKHCRNELTLVCLFTIQSYKRDYDYTYRNQQEEGYDEE
jgi:hypothetical protein